MRVEIDNYTFKFEFKFEYRFVGIFVRTVSVAVTGIQLGYYRYCFAAAYFTNPQHQY